MAGICQSTDYANPKSVIRNNKAVTRMYQIVEEIQAGYGPTGVIEFSKLMDDSHDRADLWASVHMLEKMTVEEQTEAKALSIISTEAMQSLGMEQWLRMYLEKKKHSE